jgi:hypothetical protein
MEQLISSIMNATAGELAPDLNRCAKNVSKIEVALELDLALVIAGSKRMQTSFHTMSSVQTRAWERLEGACCHSNSHRYKVASLKIVLDLVKMNHIRNAKHTGPDAIVK